MEPGNLMIAMTYVLRITGQQLRLNDLANKAAGGFFVHVHQDSVNGAPVNAMLRGGSART